jgi:hypothetical protein
MRQINLINHPFVHNAIIEISDLTDLPIPINPVYDTSNGYNNVYADGGRERAYNWDNKEESIEYFTRLFKEDIIPKFYSNKLFTNDYGTVTCEQLLRNIDIAVGVVKDEPTWDQHVHEDCRTMICAGLIHLQDTDRGTQFHGNSTDKVRYTAPSKKLSGSAWANMAHSFHSVGKGEKERYAYLISVMWKLVL